MERDSVEQLSFAVFDVDEGGSESTFVVDLDGFEGPLDLLLELARHQKVDLQKISVLALADQYLRFIESVRRLRLEIAADYLVMAAWLAYLKSRLLLPEAPTEEPAAADLAAEFARRLRRLDVLREAARRLIAAPQLGRDFFARGEPEPVGTPGPVKWQASLHDLLSAYARQRRRHALSRITLPQRVVWSLTQAREVLERLIGRAVEWSALDHFLSDYLAPPETRRTVVASTFSAALEFAREGNLDLRQDRAFAPIWIRRRLPISDAQSQ